MQSGRESLLESAVAYDGLPIGSGGSHKLGRISARDAFDAWMNFLEQCADVSAASCYFGLPVTPGLTVEPEVARRIEREFPRARDRYLVRWDRTDDALSLFESFEPLPVNKWGMAPVWLWFVADFKLRSPGSRKVWPGQDPDAFGGFETPAGVKLGASSTRLVLEAKRSIGLSLSIPEASDDDLAEVVPWLQAALPMRLSSKHWTRWTLTKSGRSYRGKKITPPSMT